MGKKLCDIFFAPYTKKMWELELEELPASVAARIPTNVESRSFDYFPKDKHQYLPASGYTNMVHNILDHPNIQVTLEMAHERLVQGYQDAKLTLPYDHIFTSEPIDRFFQYVLGELPWRSVKMNTVTIPLPQVLPSPVVNFTHDGPYTRVTEWKQLPNHGSNSYATTLTFEEPCDVRSNNNERYYPVKTSQSDCPNRALYKQYTDMADKRGGVTFIGRMGKYVYIDLHMAISSSLHAVRKFIHATTA